LLFSKLLCVLSSHRIIIHMIGGDFIVLVNTRYNPLCEAFYTKGTSELTMVETELKEPRFESKSSRKSFLVEESRSSLYFQGLRSSSLNR